MAFTYDNNLTRKVAKVLQYSQQWQVSELNGVPAIMEQWYRNKKFFIDRMDGELTVFLPGECTFELDTATKSSRLHAFADKVSNHYNCPALYEFLAQLSTEEFYSNRTFTTHVCGAVKIPADQKVVKAFRVFVIDEDELGGIQNEASRLIQENKISGQLCLSVHPLDFLSASENAHNWRNCHSLDEKYRSGNLNYMVDSTTVICYLRADRLACLPHFPSDILWNSKKWRVYLFFSNDKTMVFAGRQYPFTSSIGLDKLRTFLSTLQLGYWTKWINPSVSSLIDNTEQFEFDTMIPIGHSLEKLTEVVKDGENTHHFNDLLHSKLYHPVWSYRRRQGGFQAREGTTRVVLGESCPCPICGQGTIDASNTLCCSSCSTLIEDYSDSFQCDLCGSMTPLSNKCILKYSDLVVCPNCFKHETVACQNCGTRDLPDVVKYHDFDARCLCPDCAKGDLNYGC